MEIPVIKNYPQAEEMARFWLGNEPKRLACVQAMRERVLQRYTPEMVIRRMLANIFD